MTNALLPKDRSVNYRQFGQNSWNNVEDNEEINFKLLIITNDYNASFREGNIRIEWRHVRRWITEIVLKDSI